jgi:hypothetical protein
MPLQVRLLNSVAGLRQLAAEGLTREVYVFGLVQVGFLGGVGGNKRDAKHLPSSVVGSAVLLPHLGRCMHIAWQQLPAIVGSLRSSSVFFWSEPAQLSS